MTRTVEILRKTNAGGRKVRPGSVVEVGTDEAIRLIYDGLAKFVSIAPPPPPPVRKRCIYSVNLGHYETIKQAPDFEGWDCIMFTDDVDQPSNGWTFRNFPVDPDLGLVRTSRLPRILPHRYLAEYEESVYSDSSVTLLIDPCKWPCYGSKWGAMRHWTRDYVLQEIDANINAAKAHVETCEAQRDRCRQMSLSESAILWQNANIYRRHMDNDVIATCEAWWRYFCEYTCRDQLSLPMALHETGLVVSDLTPRTKHAGRTKYWLMQHHGYHADIYNKHEIYLVGANRRGSAIARGEQVEKGLLDRGVRAKFVVGYDEPENATVVLIKELSPKVCKFLKDRGNKIIYDIVDNSRVWLRGLGAAGEYIEQIIFPCEQLKRDWDAKGFAYPDKWSVIHHHADYRFRPNTAEGFSPVCISTAAQIPPVVISCGVECITEQGGWVGLFEDAMSYNLHIGVYPDGTAGYDYKPPSKLVTACGCRANVILQRTHANLDLMPDYPYYVNTASEIPGMLERCRNDYEKVAPWNAALAIIDSVAERVSLKAIARDYDVFINGWGGRKAEIETVNAIHSRPRVVIVGAGMTGMTAAHILSSRGVEVKVVETANQIGGACAVDKEGNHLHGAHIFHTWDKNICDFVRERCSITRYAHHVQAVTDKGLITLPYNLHSEMTTGIISDDELFDLVFRHYSERQWGMKISQIPQEVFSRLQLRREGTDCRYFLDPYQGLINFAELFDSLSKGVDIALGADAEAWRKVKADKVIYTAPLDELLHRKLGRLSYRSLMFEELDVIGVPSEAAVTNNCRKQGNHSRTIDMRRLGGTKIIREFPESHKPDFNIPYYPIPWGENQKKAEEYKRLVSPGVICAGRLGSYKYINMDEAIMQGMAAAKEV